MEVDISKCIIFFGNLADKHTIDPFACLDDLTECHGSTAIARKMWENTGAKRNLFVKIFLVPAIMAQLELRRLDVFEVGIEDT